MRSRRSLLTSFSIWKISFATSPNLLLRFKFNNDKWFYWLIIESIMLSALTFRLDSNLQLSELVVKLVYVFIDVDQSIHFLGYFRKILVFFPHHYKVLMVLFFKVWLRTCKDDYTIGLWVDINSMHFIVRWAVIRKSKLLWKKAQYV